MNIKLFIKIAISVFISAAMILYITCNYNFSELIIIIMRVNVAQLSFGILSTIFLYLIAGLRWKRLFTEYRYIDSLNGAIIAAAANTIIPARGGELFRSYFLKRVTGITIAQGLGKVIVERAMDFSILFVLLIVSLTFFSEKLVGQSNWLNYSGLIVIIAGIAMFLLYRYYADKVHDIINKISDSGGLKKRISNKIIELLTAVNSVKKSEIFLGLLITIIITAISALSLFFFLNGSGVEISYNNTILIYPLVALSISLPISVGYVGVFHGAMIIALSFIGVDNPQILGIVILVHLLTVLPPLIYAAMVLSYYYIIKSENKI